MSTLPPKKSYRTWSDRRRSSCLPIPARNLPQKVFPHVDLSAEHRACTSKNLVPDLSGNKKPDAARSPRPTPKASSGPFLGSEEKAQKTSPWSVMRSVLQWRKNHSELATGKITEVPGELSCRDYWSVGRSEAGGLLDRRWSLKMKSEELHGGSRFVFLREPGKDCF